MKLNLNDRQREALLLAASRKRGLVSAGHAFKTAHATLKALARRGLLVFVGSSGSYFDLRMQYRITDAGRALAAQLQDQGS